jgi:hypothetical protein
MLSALTVGIRWVGVVATTPPGLSELLKLLELAVDVPVLLT